MPKFLFQLAYTTDAWAAQVKNPQSAANRANAVIESLGGKVESLYYAFGEYDAVGIMDMPSAFTSQVGDAVVNALGKG